MQKKLPESFWKQWCQQAETTGFSAVIDQVKSPMKWRLYFLDMMHFLLKQDLGLCHDSLREDVKLLTKRWNSFIWYQQEAFLCFLYLFIFLCQFKDNFYFPPVDSARRIRTSYINGWSSRLVNTSWKWRCGYWSTYLQVPRLQDQRGLWLQRRVLLRPTSSFPCCWRSTAPSVKLHAPSAASCSPWSVYLLCSHREILC